MSLKIMQNVIDFDSEKATQALNFLATLEGGKINKMKALKLIWLADRYHLRKYGRPIVGDIYYAMKNGPVPSLMKDIAQLSERLSGGILEYAKMYIRPLSSYEFTSLRKPDKSVFSTTDIEALNAVYKEFGWMSPFQLADYSHHYPEWGKQEKKLEDRKSVPMKYDDFFEDPKEINVELFNLDSSHLQAAHETFEEHKKAAVLWNQT